MEQSLPELFERLEQAQLQKQHMEQALELTDQIINELKSKILATMQQNKIANYKTLTHSYGCKTKLEVKPASGVTFKNLAKLFNENGAGDLVTQIVHPSRLTSFVAESLAQTDEVPTWLQGQVNVAESAYLSISCSTKK